MDPGTAFEAFFTSTYADLLRFVERRARGQHGEDVVAETYLIAWRRRDDVPDDQGEARAWLFGTARQVLLNAERGASRRQALGVALLAVRTGSPDDSDLAVARADLGRAWPMLSEVHQESLALAVLDGLSAPHAAKVLNISPVAFRLRLSRARRALRALLSVSPNPERSFCNVS